MTNEKISEALKKVMEEVKTMKNLPPMHLPANAGENELVRSMIELAHKTGYVQGIKFVLSELEK